MRPRPQGKETRSSSGGPLRRAVRVWSGPHHSPVITGEKDGQRSHLSHPHQPPDGDEGCSLEKQLPPGGRGRCLPQCWGFCPNTSRHASLEGPWVARTPLGEASPSGMDPGLVLDSEAVKGLATRSPALGYNAERMNISHAVGHPSLGALHRDCTLTRMMPPRQQRLLACVRSPMTPGLSNDSLPLQHQSFLEGSRLGQRGQDGHSCPPLHLERTHSEDSPATTGSPGEGLSP